VTRRLVRSAFALALAWLAVSCVRKVELDLDAAVFRDAGFPFEGVDFPGDGGAPGDGRISDGGPNG
jgi:hypothetical protein